MKCCVVEGSKRALEGGLLGEDFFDCFLAGEEAAVAEVLRMISVSSFSEKPFHTKRDV